MQVFDYHFSVEASLDRVQRFHSSPEVLNRLTPPPLRVKIYQFGEMEEGMTARFALTLGPVAIDWEARHEDVSSHGFTDVQVSGPLKRWRHTHRFVPISEARTEIREHIEYEYPSGLKGWISRLGFGWPALWSLFTYRKWVTRRSLSE